MLQEIVFLVLSVCGSIDSIFVRHLKLGPGIFTNVCCLHATMCHVLKSCELFQVANGLYYNAPMCLTILQHLGVTSEIFQAWFQMLYAVKKTGKPLHFVRFYFFPTFCYFSIFSYFFQSSNSVVTRVLLLHTIFTRCTCINSQGARQESLYPWISFIARSPKCRHATWTSSWVGSGVQSSFEVACGLQRAACR